MTRTSALLQSVLLAFLLAAVGCAQPVPADRSDYVGLWQGDGVRLLIQADGQAHYERVKDKRRTSINGPAHSFTTAGFKIGIGPLSAGFKVQSPPTLVDGAWRMTVDGRVLERVDLKDSLQKSQPTITL